MTTLNTSFPATEPTAPEISSTGTKFPKSVAFEIAKPQVISNRGLSGGPKKNFRRQQPQQTSVALSLVGQTLQQDHNPNQMTPGSVHEKHKQRINLMNETTKSIKLPI